MSVKWEKFIEKSSGANEVPHSVGYFSGRPFTGDHTNLFPGPNFNLKGTSPRNKTWMGMGTYDLSEEAAQYPGEYSDEYYHNILVGGANAGGEGFTALSELPFGVLAKGKNRTLFRNGEIQKIRGAIERLIRKGKPVRVIGHSWGAADVARLAKDYPGVEFFAMDPCSWTGRIDSIPKNLTIARPDGSMNRLNVNRLAQIFGGQWPIIRKGEGKTVTYQGDHVYGVGNWLTKMNREVRDARIANQRKQELLSGLAAKEKPKAVKE